MELTVVICGWHFKNEKIYRTLVSEVENYNNNEAGSKLEAKYFIASHKSQEKIEKNILSSITQLGWNVLYFKNEGWDWGAYQQFLLWQKDNSHLTDYYLLLHDDIKIKNLGFIKVFLEKINQGAKIVGNGTAVQKSHKVRQDYPEDLVWTEMQGYPIRSSKWEVVRGSCLFITRDVAKSVLIKIPIKKGRNILFANSSLRIFGGLVADMFGQKAVAYIGDEPRTSFYIDEEYRGQDERKRVTIKEIISICLDASPVGKVIVRLLRGKRIPPVRVGTGMKINVSYGGECLPGYFNIDMNSPYAEMKKDILDVDFPAQSISTILMVHYIEHVEYDNVLILLRKMYKWLRVDGQLILEFPDIIKLCKPVLKNKRNPDKLFGSPDCLRGIYGNLRKGITIYDYHKWGWSKCNMVPILNNIGFKTVNVERAHHHSTMTDTRIVAIK
ncbi:MAG: class I SAM-dependent methyltransferase [Bacteroidales bacterium]|nr:class I SAM-dependent methyltransferase [Bacteroidales bacterium]